MSDTSVSLDAVSRKNPAGFRDLPPDALVDHLGRVRLVDVREPHEYTAGHVPGAELVPLGTVPAASASWRPDEPLVVICRSGGRSSRAAALLASRGFAHVYNLDGGMLAWDDGARDVEREA